METTTMPLPLQEGWEDRVKLKLGCTALAAATISAHNAYNKHLPMFREVPRQMLGYSAAMAIFCGTQEGLRALRGKSDAINSLVAGAVAGAAAAGYYQGPQYRLLAALLWGPICGGVHFVNSVTRPRLWIEDWLISEELLDASVRARRAQPEQSSTVGASRRPDSFTEANLIDEATRIRDQELMQILGLQPAATASAGPSGRPEVGGARGHKGAASSGAEAWGKGSTAGPAQAQQVQAQAAGGRGVKEEEGFDETEYRRWLASAKSIGANVISTDDDDDSVAALRSSGSASVPAAAGAAEAKPDKRSWFGAVRSWVGLSTRGPRQAPGGGAGAAAEEGA